jgi:hypothetical protein
MYLNILIFVKFSGLAASGAFLKIKADFDKPTSYLSNEGGEKFGAWVSHWQFLQTY